MIRPLACIAMAAALWTQAGCSRAQKPAAPSAKTAEERARDLVRINQFYATIATLHPGEKELLCYGVENARAVWLSPPRRELSAAYSRCVEVTPAATTTYTLTAEGSDGATAIALRWVQTVGRRRDFGWRKPMSRPCPDPPCPRVQIGLELLVACGDASASAVVGSGPRAASPR